MTYAEYTTRIGTPAIACDRRPDPRAYGATQTAPCLLEAGHTGCHVSHDQAGYLSGFGASVPA